jgi:Na+/H+ antiporter NhaC
MLQHWLLRRANLVIAVLLFLGLGALFRSLPVDTAYLVGQTDRSLMASMAEQVKAAAGQHGVTLAAPDAAVLAALQHAEVPIGGPAKLTTGLGQQGHERVLTWSISDSGASGEERKRLPDWLTVLPPLVAITLALATQRLFLSLIAGILTGAALVAGGSPLGTAKLALGQYLWSALADVSHLQVFGFTAALLGMVTVFNRSGGTQGIARAFLKLAKTTRSTQAAAWLMGLGVFFDDYANTMVVGSSMRPITDRLRISREKLAYIVDTTSAPVSAVAIISTWVGYQVGLIQTSLDSLGLKQNGFNALVQAIPYRFYCMFALTLLLLVILLKRDFGPMLRAERRARTTGGVLREGAKILTSKGFSTMETKPGIPCRWQNAVLPVLALVLTMLAGLFVTGGGWTAVQARPGAVVEFAVWRDAFSNGSTGAVLCWAAITGSVVAILLAIGQRLLTVSEALGAWWKGAVSMGMAAGLLTLAWTLNGVCSDLGTAYYLVSAFKDLVSPMLIPALVFAMGAVTSFAVGSSWSTMAILVPTTLPLAYAVGQHSSAGGLFVLMVTTGAVLDGAVVGDHCSPLADTTLMTSITTSCDLLDHVVTQLPYGLLGAGTALVIGYIPAGLGTPLWACYLGGTAFFTAFLLLFGRDPELSTEPETESVTPSAVP